jgi:Cu2+-exporting ATPase
MRIVRQNLVWALVYNIGVIPAAALGYVSPALAAVGMAVSSLLVVGNALRARRLPALEEG